MLDTATCRQWVSPMDYDFTVSDFSPNPPSIRPAHSIRFESEKGRIEIDTFTGNVKIVGLSPDEAALEFWRGLERAFPAAFPNRNAR